jgi:ribonuclease HI
VLYIKKKKKKKKKKKEKGKIEKILSKRWKEDKGENERIKKMLERKRIDSKIEEWKDVKKGEKGKDDYDPWKESLATPQGKVVKKRTKVRKRRVYGKLKEGKIEKNTMEEWAGYDIPDKVVKAAEEEQAKKGTFDVGGEKEVDDDEKRLEIERLTPHNFRVMTYNISGLSREKITEMMKVVITGRPAVICLQETHVKDEEDANVLRRALRGYMVFIPSFRGRTRGVAVAVRSSMITPHPGPGDIVKGGPDDGCSMSVKTVLNETTYLITNIYRHTGKMTTDELRKALRVGHRVKGENIVAGDFNEEPGSEIMNLVQEICSELGTARLEWNGKTHFAGRCIDHIFFPCDVDEERKFVNAIPTPFKDHAIIIGGSSMKTWHTTSHKKQIPSRFIKDPEFVEEVLRVVGEYDKAGDPTLHLRKFKEAAWTACREWKKKAPDEKFDRLWKLHQVERKYKALYAIPTQNLSTIEAEIEAEAVRRCKKGRKKIGRKEILSKARGIIKEWVIALELQCDIHQIQETKLKKVFKAATVKGVLMDGKILRGNAEVKDAITNFWADLFGTVRPICKEALDEMVDQYPRKFDPQERHVVSEEQVMALITRTNKSSCGPDGIPFSLYKASATSMKGMWRDLIQNAGEEGMWDKGFMESQLCLIPKVEGIPRVDQFRPIMITNSDYRIVTRYWAKWFIERACTTISKEQNVMGEGRSIDQAIESIHDHIMDCVIEGIEIAMLQTDFKKAYDLVNREALIYMLEKTQAPRQIINVTKKIMIESDVTMPELNKDGRSCPPVTIPNRTGVRQGCPISPLLYICIYDLLVEALKASTLTNKVSAYMDDLAVSAKPANINELSPIFDLYCKATGGHLNYDKCYVLSTGDYNPKGPMSEMPHCNYKGWRVGYLGVPISLKIEPLKDWGKIIAKMKSTARRIKSLRVRQCVRIRLVNTYMMSVMGYMGRFKIMSKKVASEMWKVTRTAIGAMAGNSVLSLTSRSKPFGGKGLRHPVLDNWSRLISRHPSGESLNPQAISEARREAQHAASKLCGVEIPFGTPVKLTYQILAEALEIRKDDIVPFPDIRWDCLFYNISNPINPAVKRTLVKAITNRWATRNKTSHMAPVADSCRLCGKERESTVHLLVECPTAVRLWAAMKKTAEKVGVSTWRFSPLLDLTGKFMNGPQTGACAAAITALWCITNDGEAATEAYAQKVFLSVATKAKLIPKTKIEPKKDGKKPHPPPPSGEDDFTMYYDGSGRFDPLQAGAGFAVYQGTKEVATGCSTIPFGTNNIGEYTAALLGIRAARTLTTSIKVIGDCEILTNAMNNDEDGRDPELWKIRRAIKEECKNFATISFHHVTREFNKRADQIVTAASISRVAGEKACKELEWDPRKSKIAADIPAIITSRSARYERFMTPGRCDAVFPAPKTHRVTTTKVLQNEYHHFPGEVAEGTTMKKGLVSFTLWKHFPGNSGEITDFP